MKVVFFKGRGSSLPEMPVYWAARLLRADPAPGAARGLASGEAGRAAGRAPLFPGARRGRGGASLCDLLYPVFCGAVVSAFLCVFALFPLLSRVLPGPAASAVFAGTGAVRASAAPAALAGRGAVRDGSQNRTGEVEAVLVRGGVSPLSLVTAPEHPDLIREAWQDTRRRDDVLAFFEEMTQSEYLASCVLVNAEVFDIPPGLAFALCWEESRFNPRAVNNFNRDESVDRGLFQLNNRSFPRLEEEQFFDLWLNAYYGLAHLRWCLDKGGSVVAALAMYNAGTVRVTSGGGAPKQTLDYVSRILVTAQKIDLLYREHCPVTGTVEEPAPIEESPASPRLALLGPARRLSGGR